MSSGQLVFDCRVQKTTTWLQIALYVNALIFTTYSGVVGQLMLMHQIQSMMKLEVTYIFC